MNNHEHNPHNSEFPKTLSVENLREWSLPEEDKIFRRVKRQLDQRFFTSAGLNLQRRHWAMLSLAGTSLALLIFLLWSPPSQQTTQHLKIQGSVTQLKTKPSTPFPNGFHFQLPANKQGQIGVPERWKIQAEGKTRLTVLTPKHDQKVQLHQGFVRVYVKPKSMKSFVIKAKDYQITVHGTKFTVERTKTWLRLEVWKGKVSLSAPSQTRSFLTKRQGIRIHLSTHKLLHYPLPPLAKQEPYERWKWLEQKQQTRLLLQYLRDVSESQRYTKQERAEWLQAAASWTRRHRLLKASFQFQWRLYLQGQKEGKDQRLFRAAQACRKAYSIVSKRCAGLYQNYIHNYSGNHTYRSFSQYWFWVHRFVTSPSETMAVASLVKFVSLNKGSYFHEELSRLLTAQKTLKSEVFCQWLKPIVSLKHRQSWTKRRCPGKP